MKAFLALLSLASCAGTPPCNAAFHWESGVAAGGACELVLSHDSAAIAFEVPPLQTSVCPATTVSACGPSGTTCTRTCTTLSITADESASREIVTTLGTSNIDTVLRCGSFGHEQADVIIETTSADLQACAP